MITGGDVGLMVKYWKDRWHTGTLVALQKTKNKFIAVIQTPIANQRKRRVPAEDCEVYTENVQMKGKP